MQHVDHQSFSDILKLKEALNPPRERSPVNLDWYYENISPLVTAGCNMENQAKIVVRS